MWVTIFDLQRTGFPKNLVDCMNARKIYQNLKIHMMQARQNDFDIEGAARKPSKKNWDHALWIAGKRHCSTNCTISLINKWWYFDVLLTKITIYKIKKIIGGLQPPQPPGSNKKLNSLISKSEFLVLEFERCFLIEESMPYEKKMFLNLSFLYAGTLIAPNEFAKKKSWGFAPRPLHSVASNFIYPGHAPDRRLSCSGCP